MSVLGELAEWVGANKFLHVHTLALNMWSVKQICPWRKGLPSRLSTTHMMPVDAIVGFAILAQLAGVQTREVQDGIELLLRRPCFMYEATAVTLGTWAPKEMVVA